MPLVMNASIKDQQVKVLGNWFTFKAGQMKPMSPEYADWMGQHLASLGFVVLPDRLNEEVDETGTLFKQTEEGKKLIEEAKESGIRMHIEFLNGVVRNGIDSKRKDYQMKNIDTDPRNDLSKGEIEALNTLMQYRKGDLDEENKRAEAVKKMQTALGLGTAK